MAGALRPLRVGCARFLYALADRVAPGTSYPPPARESQVIPR